MLQNVRELEPGFVGNPEESAAQQSAAEEPKRPLSQQVPQGAADSIWDRIRRHKVVEWTLAYVAFGYAALHLVQMLRETYEWPLLVPRLTVAALVLGLPVTVTLAWYHGHRAQHRVSRIEIGILAALLLIAGSVLWILSRNSNEGRVPAAPVATLGATAAPPVFAPPPHSIAVLPFVNLSGDKEQEYFSDGLTEELLNSLVQINDLQVAASTSSFSFKEHPDIMTVARKLNVASVLEGSVRRSEHTVRITAQLVNATTGFHVWSKSYDRDLGNVLKLQTEIATAVAETLKVTLLGDVASKIQLGGTHDPTAFDAYLRGTKARARVEAKSQQDAIAAYTDAIDLDPNYALAFAGRSIAYSNYAGQFATGAAIHENFGKALADARQTLALAPALAEGHFALAWYFQTTLEFAQASEAFDRARALAPGNVPVLRVSGSFAVRMGQIEPGLAALRGAVVRDPLNPLSHNALSQGLYFSRRYRAAVDSATSAINLDSDFQSAYAQRGLAEYGLGDLAGARASCGAKPHFWLSEQCLAVTYDRLGRRADAEAVLAKMQAAFGDAAAYQYATIYAQWGNSPQALKWLDRARRLRDPGLELLKSDPLMDPLRNDPRFRAVMRELRFPQ
jgi:TolB-like protein/Tfp pilus assembly protein PilF